MATIRPADLPAAASVANTAALVVDTGSTVEKATPAQVVDAATPLASQAEAEAGADNAKRMTPLRVKQAMDANMATTAALASTASGKGGAMVVLPTGRTVTDKAGDIVSAKDKGAVADGVTDTLSALDALVQEFVPHSGFSGTGRVNRGKFALTGSLEIPNFVNLSGEGKHASILLGAAGVPVLLNGDPVALIFSKIEDFQVRGGSHGLRVTGYMDNLSIRDIEIQAATTAGIEVDGFFQTSILDNVRIAGAPYAIKSNTTIANNILIIRPDITGCETALYLRGSEDFTVVGGRFEGGGHATKPVLDFENTRSLTFLGGYFEGGSLKLLKAVNSHVEFLGTHFTFQSVGVPYQWDIDATSRLTFRNCHSTIPMVVPAGSVVENCVNITVSSAYTATVSDVDTAGVAGSQDCDFWRESSNRIRVRCSVTLNQTATGFLKVTLPPGFALAEPSIATAYNVTTNSALSGIVNLGDSTIYVFSIPTGSNVGVSGDTILVEATYRHTG